MQAAAASALSLRAREIFEDLHDSIHAIKDEIVLAASQSGAPCEEELVTSGLLDFELHPLLSPDLNLADHVLTLARFRAVAESFFMSAEESMQAPCVAADVPADTYSPPGVHSRAPAVARMSVIHAPALLLLSEVRL